MTGLPLNIDDLIHARVVEGNRLEFKANWGDNVKESVTRSICAFANDLLNLNGGYVVLGIEQTDQGLPLLPPSGVAGNIDRIQQEIRGQCRRIQPDYQPLLFPVEYQSRPLLVIWAPAGDNRPYQCPRRVDEGDRAYFVRQGSETVEAKGDILRQLLERTAKIPFDDRRNLNANLDSVSPSLVRQFLADVRSDLVHAGAAIDDREVYRRMNLVVRVNDHETPRNVALLFFSEDPDRIFRGARIEVVQFSDDAGGDLIEERVIRGPIPQQIRQTLQALNNLVETQLRKRPGDAEVEKAVAYPFEAMEEAIVNAVYHRSYDGAPEPSKVYLYPDRLEIISYPGPVPGIERAHFESRAGVPPTPARNRRIGELLKELRLAEARGTGLPKIRRGMEQNGSPAPSFDFDDARSYFRVTLPAHPNYRVVHALREASRLWAVGERVTAVDHLRRAFESRPDSGALAGQLIDYAMASGAEDVARQVLDRFEATSPKSQPAVPYLRYASSLLNLGRNSEARSILAKVPQGFSVDDDFELAILRKRQGDLRGSHQLFEKLRQSKMNDARYLQEFAQVKTSISKDARDLATKKRLTREAVEMLRRAIQLSNDRVREGWCWYNLAQQLAFLREPNSQVEEAYLKAISLLPEESRFRDNYDKWKARV
jgi:ATP-dependent DNA helicase RecG